MTRRERLERKLELRREWAIKAEAKSQAAFNTAHRIGDAIPMGQPILVGHHSERHHRRDIARIDSNMARGVERSKMAEHHTACAGGIAVALGSSIFSDDSDAVKALEQRIAEREAERERMKTVNKLYRKGDAEGLAALGFDLEVLRAKLKTAYSWCQQPYPAYELSNLGGRITADRKRLDVVKRQQTRSTAAEQSPNGVIIEGTGEYIRVTFAEKPEREILNALRAANFGWGGGSWTGRRDALPQAVRDLVA